MLTFDFIKTHTNAKTINPALMDAHTEVSVVDFDSRRLTDNSCYIALTIGTTDGHQYIEDALNKGVRVVVVSNQRLITEDFLNRAVFFLVDDTLLAFQKLAKAYRLNLNIPVIGITGSNGKTTSKDIIATLLESQLSVHKTYKNFNNHLGVPLTILQAKPSHDVMVLEMGMNHAGELDVLGDISKPNYVVITNIGESHIEHLGSRENIAHAKGELLPHLQTGGTVFLPGESEFKALLGKKTAEKKVFFGAKTAEKVLESEEWLTAHSLGIENGLTVFEITTSLRGNVEQYSMALYGEHNMLNTLPAIYLAKELGLTPEHIAEGLLNLTISPMRFERLRGKNNTVIINDAYNASPTSMMKSSETFLHTFTLNRRVLVLGDMYELGDDTEKWHQSVGVCLNEHLDQVEFLITVGTQARFISGAFKGRKRHFESKEEASKFLHVFLQEDFALFFKASRGMKLETIVNTLL